MRPGPAGNLEPRVTKEPSPSVQQKARSGILPTATGLGRGTLPPVTPSGVRSPRSCEITPVSCFKPPHVRIIFHAIMDKSSHLVLHLPNEKHATSEQQRQLRGISVQLRRRNDASCHITGYCGQAGNGRFEQTLGWWFSEVDAPLTSVCLLRTELPF